MQAQDLTEIVNQIFDMEKKITDTDLENTLARNIRRIKNKLEAMGIRYHNPLGETYDETRLDCEAMIGDNAASPLLISEVVKPIIHHHENGTTRLLQRAVVIID